MRLTIASLATAISLAIAPVALAQDNAAPEPARVMVLGSFHFSGGGADMINPEVDDYLAPARQAEIAAVLDQLAAFAPTRIAEPGERVLVIYGSGHKALLDQFVDEAPNLVWVDPLDFLGTE
jgi:uncharacterized protein DUF5694